MDIRYWHIDILHHALVILGCGRKNYFEKQAFHFGTVLVGAVFRILRSFTCSDSTRTSNALNVVGLKCYVKGELGKRLRK